MSEIPTALIVDHNRTDHCGLYQLGKRTWQILQGSKRYRFEHVRADSIEEFGNLPGRPAAVLFNYYPGAMDWAFDVPRYWPDGVYAGFAHEITHPDAKTPQHPFKTWIVFDPSFPDSDIYLRTMPPLPAPYRGAAKPPEGRFLVGSCGFALRGKGYEYVIRAAAKELKGLDPLVRLHIPPAHFAAGFPHEEYYALLREMARDSGVDLEITTDFLPDDELLAFLASNHLNCLFYGPNQGRGISSSADWCLASGRPLAITMSEQFRHLALTLKPYPRRTLKQTIEAGCDPVLSLQQQWSHAAFVARYEEIVDGLVGNIPV